MEQLRRGRAREAVRALHAIKDLFGDHATPENVTAAAIIYAGLLAGESQS